MGLRRVHAKDAESYLASSIKSVLLLFQLAKHEPQLVKVWELGNALFQDLALLVVILKLPFYNGRLHPHPLCAAAV